MIVLYKGAKGKGKTLTMVKDGLKYKLKGYRVLSNFWTSFTETITNEEILNLDKNSNLFNCCLLIDEIQIFFDSRTGMKKANRNFSNFIQQSRKRNIDILTTTQYAHQIDKRLRAFLDVIAFPNFIKRFNVCEVTYIDLTRFEDNDLITGSSELKPMTMKIVFNAEPIFKLYNTREMIT